MLISHLLHVISFSIGAVVARQVLEALHLRLIWRDHDLDMVVLVLNQLLESSLSDIVDMDPTCYHRLDAFELA